MASQLAQVISSYGQDVSRQAGKGLREGVEGGIKTYFGVKKMQQEKQQATEEKELRDIQTQSAKMDLFKNKYGGAIIAADKPEKWLAAQEKGFIPKEMEYQDREAFTMGMLQDEAMKQEELNLKKKASEIAEQRLKSDQAQESLQRETNELKREELELKIESSRREERQKRIEAANLAKSQMRQQKNLIATIDKFLPSKENKETYNEEYVDSMTGWRGRMMPIKDVGIEAESFFNQIKNTLTLENLDKMSGVLSESDILILSNAATALVPGMSKKAMESELTKIKEVLKDKSAETQAMLLGIIDIPAQPPGQAVAPQGQPPAQPVQGQPMQQPTQPTVNQIGRFQVRPL